MFHGKHNAPRVYYGFVGVVWAVLGDLGCDSHGENRKFEWALVGF